MIQHRICMTGVALLLSLSYAWTETTQASNRPEPKATITWYAKAGVQTSLKERSWQHAKPVESVAFSPDGKQVLTGSLDNTAVLRDAATGQTLQTWRHTGGVYTVAFSPDGKQVLTGSLDNTAVLRDAATGQTLQTWKHNLGVPSVAFSPDGKQVLTGSFDNTAVLRDAATGQTLHTWRHSGSVLTVAFSPDGKQVLTGSLDNTAVLRDSATGQTLHTWRHSASVRTVAFSPDGKQVLTGSSDGTAVLRDSATGQTLQTWRHSESVHTLAFSPDGKQVLTGSSDGTAVLRDSATGQTLQTWWHAAWVKRVAFSPDGKQVLTGTHNGEVFLRPNWFGANSLSDSIKTFLQKAESAHRDLPKALDARRAELNSNKPQKDEFESVANFGLRVAQWNKAVDKLNADAADHYKRLGSLPLKQRAEAFEEAISDAYGNPKLTDVRYDPELARFFATLGASFNPQFKRTISIAVPNNEARAAKAQLESDQNGLVIELEVTEKNQLIWGAPKVNLGGKVVVAQYIDKNFVSPDTSQLASAPALKGIDLPQVLPITPGPAPQITRDPKLAELQMQVLERERQQAQAAARQAEEERLRGRLAELNRVTESEFIDDLPSLLAKLPASKPNPRVHVLAIGINDYSDVPNVPFADRSALQFAELTKKLFGAQSQNVVVLTNAEATSGRLRGRLRTLLNRLEPRDQLLIYYAGHGVPSKDGKSAYLLAQDGGPGSYQEPDLRLEQLYAAVAQSRVGKAKLFIDACFSGRSGRDTIIFEGVAPITVAPKQALPNSQSIAVLTAGRGDQFSNQDKARGHRLFGYHLMRVLLEQGSSISMETLHTSLRQKVLNDSRRIGPEFEQEPELHGNKKLSF
jgi:WD40 repeat protein